jgi:hypothetical protein
MASQPDYIKQLEALPPKLREAWLYGNWDIFEGQVFEEFRISPDSQACALAGISTEDALRQRRYTHVIKPFDIPPHWRIYRSFDWGYHHPFATLWFAVDDDSVVYNILEYYGCTGTPDEGIKWTPAQVFAEIHRIEVEHPWLKGKNIIGVADPAIWDAETGESIAETAAKHQVFFSPGDHKRIPGLMQCHYYLHMDDNGFPMFYTFENCKNFIRTIPLLQYDEHKVEDIDTSQEDHLYDAWRYFLMTRPIKPRAKAVEDSYKLSPLNTILDIPKDMVGKRKPIPRMQIIDGG